MQKHQPHCQWEDCPRDATDLIKSGLDKFYFCEEHHDELAATTDADELNLDPIDDKPQSPSRHPDVESEILYFTCGQCGEPFGREGTVFLSTTFTCSSCKHEARAKPRFELPSGNSY